MILHNLQYLRRVLLLVKPFQFCELFPEIIESNKIFNIVQKYSELSIDGFHLTPQVQTMNVMSVYMIKNYRYSPSTCVY